MVERREDGRRVASAFGETIATAASAASRGHQQARPHSNCLVLTWARTPMLPSGT